MATKSRPVDVSDRPLIPYCRISKVKERKSSRKANQRRDRQTIGVDRQWKIIQLHAEDERLPLRPDGPIMDNDRSAMFDAAPRPGWDEVMALITTGRYGGVIVFDADRAARDGWMGEQVIKLVRDKNLKGFRVISPGDAYDLSTPDGVSAWRRAIDGAEREGIKIRYRTTAALAEKAQEGELTGGPPRRFGFLDAYENLHHPKEAQALRDAAPRILSDESPRLVAENIKAQGIRTTSGLEIAPKHLKELLLRPLNAGIITAGATRGQLPGEPILTVETHEALVAHYAKQRRGRPAVPNRYLLGGIDVLFCGRCDSRMGGSPTKNRQGHEYIYYRCRYGRNTDRRSGCFQSIAATRLEELVRDYTIARWSDPLARRKDAARLAALDERVGEAQARLRRVEVSLFSVQTKVREMGKEDDPFYQRLMASDIDERERLLAELDELVDETPRAALVTPERAAEMWDERDLAGRQQMISAVIAKVRVHPRSKSIKVFDPSRVEVVYRDAVPAA